MKPFRTKVKKMQGERAHLNPMWRTELWVPIVVPTSTQTIKYSIWDYETIGPNELVAMFYDRFNVIDRLCGADPKGIRPHWVNLYGAQTGVGGTALESRHHFRRGEANNGTQNGSACAWTWAEVSGPNR